MSETEITREERPMKNRKTKKAPDKKEAKKFRPENEARKSDALACYFSSKQALADWNRPEEDEAWKNL